MFFNATFNFSRFLLQKAPSKDLNRKKDAHYLAFFVKKRGSQSFLNMFI